MQLHACLLLFIITTDKTLASLLHRCGGNVSLDQQPAGHINLTLPGLFTDTNNRLNPMNKTHSNCTWTISIPLGRTVLFRLPWLESGWGVSVRCVLNQEDQILESEGAALLSGCHGNKATFTWTGAEKSSNEVQLSYYVQEDERNSSEDGTGPHSDLSPRSQTGTSFTSAAAVGQEVVRGTEEGRGRLYEGLQSASVSPSSQDQGLLHPTSPLQGLAEAGRADRETLPLPEEKPNNGADTSGAAHLAGDKISARVRTHPYFQRTDSAFHTETSSQMQMTHKTSSNSSTLLGTEQTATQMSKISLTTQVSSSTVLPFTSSPPVQPSQESGTTLTQHDGAVSRAPEEKLPPFWRSQRSTNPQTMHKTSSSSNILLGTEQTTTQTSKISITLQESSSTIPPFTSSPLGQPSQESGATLTQHVGAVSGTPEEKLPPSWRSQRSTNPQTMHKTSSSSNILLGTEQTTTQTSKISITLQESSSTIPPFTSSPFGQPSQESGATLTQHVGAVSGAPKEKLPPSWRSQRSTNPQMKHETSSSSNTLLGTEQTTTQTSKTPITTQVSSSTVLPFTSSPLGQPSQESDTTLTQHVGAVSGAPEEKLPPFWRSQRSTNPQMMHKTSSSSNALLGTEQTTTETSKISITLQESSSAVLPFTSSPPVQPSQESGTTLTQHVGAVSGTLEEKLPPSWRSQRSTNPQMIHKTSSSSNTLLGTEQTTTQTSKISRTTQISSSTIPPFTSSPLGQPSQESGATLTQHVGAVSGAPEEKLPPSWRSQRSTNPQMKHKTSSSSNTLLGTEQTTTQTSKISRTRQVSSSTVPPFTSSPPVQPSQESGATLTQHDGAVSRAPEEELPPFWRSQRSTDGLNSDPTSTVTSDPLTSSTEPQQDVSSTARTDLEPTASSGMSHSSTITTHTAVSTASLLPRRSDSSVSAASDVTTQTAAFESSDKYEKTEIIFTSTQTQTNAPQSTESLTHSSPPHTSSPFTQSYFVNADTTTNTVSSSPHITKAGNITSTSSGSSSTLGAAATLEDQTSAATTDTETLRPTYTLSHDNSATNSPTPASLLSSTPSYTLQTHTVVPSRSHFTHTPLLLLSTTTKSAPHTPIMVTTTAMTVKSHTPHTQTHLPSSTEAPVTHKQPHNYITTTHTPLLSHTTAKSDYGHDGGIVKTEDESLQSFPSSTATQTQSWTTPRPSRVLTPSSVVTSGPTWSSTTTQTPKFYIVPDQPAAIRVESVELLLQIIVEDSRSAFSSGLEEDTTDWVEPYLQRAPGFSRLMGVWSSGHAVQSLVEFKTSGALQWLGTTGPTSLLERTGLSEAVSEGRSFRSSKITNITLGGVQADVCDWLLQCPAGYRCVFQPDASNYSCSSVCHSDHCHHHGICTHHPGQPPVCRCLVGEDFWYMGQRCDVKMTRARLVGACLAILLIMVTVIGALAFVAVRRYKALLIQAKVDQTRSSYRRFNHFDELSGRFWLRSWAGSADSLDNPAFTRSDELLHLRALDRPCCYHDDTLSLASTCPSHGARINTIYPHSSQYGWRGSEMSMGDGVLDSGKASDLSVCSWPVEPIQWTPFPLLQQLASHRTPTVRVSRPRSYCEGMELVDMGRSWTA